MSTAGTPSPEQVLRRIFWKLLFRGRAAQQMQTHRVKKQLSMGLTLFFYGLFGVLPAMTAFAVDTFTFASLLHAFTFMFASLTLATSAGTMLFVKEEAEILLHRPVTPQQLLRAKTAVLVAFSLILALALNLAGLITGLWSKGATWRFIPAHLVSTLLLMVFSAACIVLVYNVCLKWFGREKLDNLLTTLQTVLAIVMMCSGQVLPRFIGSQTVQHLKVGGWALALPPVWFGALDALLSGAAALQAVWIPVSFAVAGTGLVVWLAFGKLGSAYGEGLMALNESSGTAETESKRRRRRLLPALVNLPPLRWWLRDPVERHAFLLTSAYMARDREIKLKLYPGLAPMLIMPLAMLFSMSGLKHAGATTWVQSFAACYLAIVPLQAMMLLNRSEHWRASAFFQAAPLPHWSPLFHGARKAVLGWLTYPMLVLQGLALAALQKSPTPLFMTLPALIFLPAFSLVPGLVKTWLPLSLPAEEQRDAGAGCLFMAVVMGVSASIGGLAMWMWSLGWFWPFLAVEALVMLGVTALLSRMLRARPWQAADE